MVSWTRRKGIWNAFFLLPKCNLIPSCKIQHFVGEIIHVYAFQLVFWIGQCVEPTCYGFIGVRHDGIGLHFISGGFGKIVRLWGFVMFKTDFQLTQSDLKTINRSCVCILDAQTSGHSARFFCHRNFGCQFQSVRLLFFREICDRQLWANETLFVSSQLAITSDSIAKILCSDDDKRTTATTLSWIWCFHFELGDFFEGKFNEMKMHFVQNHWNSLLYSFSVYKDSLHVLHDV